MASVGADDEQHHEHRTHQQPQQRTNGTDDLVLERNGLEGFLPVVGIGVLELPRERSHLRIQLGGGDSGPGAGDGALVIAGALGILRTRRTLDPDDGLFREGEAGGQHADDGAGAPAVADEPAEGGLGGAEVLAGEGAGDEGFVAVQLTVKEAAGNWLNADDAAEARADGGHVHIERLTIEQQAVLSGGVPGGGTRASAPCRLHRHNRHRPAGGSTGSH